MDKKLYEKDYFFIKMNEFALVEFINKQELLHTIDGSRYHKCFKSELIEEKDKRIYKISPGNMRFPTQDTFYETEITVDHVVIHGVNYIKNLDGWRVKSNELEMSFQIFLKGKFYPEKTISLKTEWFIDMTTLAKMINLMNRYFKYGGLYDELNFDIIANYNKNTFLYGDKGDYAMSYLISTINDLDISYQSHFQSRPGKDDVTHYSMKICNFPQDDYYFQNLLFSYFRNKYHDNVSFDDDAISIRDGHSYSYGSAKDDRITDDREKEIVKNIREMLIARFAIAYDSTDHLVHYLSKNKPDVWIQF